MVDQHQVLAIAGPMTTDNALAVLDLVEERRVPAITICGTQEYVGRYAFNLSNGNLADEPAYMAAWLKSRRHRRVAVLRDYPSRIGLEYHRFFEYACQQFDLDHHRRGQCVSQCTGGGTDGNHGTAQGHRRPGAGLPRLWRDHPFSQQGAA